MEKRNCEEEGHDLEEVMTVAGYRCKSCKYYKPVHNISKYTYGTCPKCDAPRNKLKVNFSGSEHLAYECKNCGHSWRELM